MSFAEIQKEVEQLDLSEQKKLMGFLVGLEIRRDGAYRQRLSDILDDKDPKRWVSLEDLERRLDIH